MASQKPVVLYDGRGRPIQGRYSSGRGTLIDPQRMSQTYQNKSITRLDRDFHDNVGTLSRLDLLSLGRYLFANFGPVRMALSQMACYATDDFRPSYIGDDLEFSESFRTWLPFHDLSPDVGSLANMQQIRRLIVISAFRDGDVGVVLTRRDGRPKLQLIPAHRIGGRVGDVDVIQGGRFDGARLLDGVIVDPATHRPLGYRVFTGSLDIYTEFEDIPISSMRLFMSSMDFIGQHRGMSALGGSAFNWLDISEWNKNELLAQRTNSALTLIKKVEGGEADLASEMIGMDTDPETCEPTSFYEEFRGGDIVYITPTEAVEAFIADRPTDNQREFIQSAIRNALAYMGFSIDFTYDATRIGGASMRVVADQAKKRVEEIQSTLLEPCLRWYYGYAIAKAIKNETLRASVDPWNLRFIGSKHITSDRRYDSQVDLAELRAGLSTVDEKSSLRGHDWKTLRNQRQREAEDLLTRAKALSDAFGITIEAAIALIDDTVKTAPANFTDDPEPTPAQGGFQR